MGSDRFWLFKAGSLPAEGESMPSGPDGPFLASKSILNALFVASGPTLYRVEPRGPQVNYTRSTIVAPNPVERLGGIQVSWKLEEEASKALLAEIARSWCLPMLALLPPARTKEMKSFITDGKLEHAPLVRRRAAALGSWLRKFATAKGVDERECMAQSLAAEAISEAARLDQPHIAAAHSALLISQARSWQRSEPYAGGAELRRMEEQLTLRALSSRFLGTLRVDDPEAEIETGYDEPTEGAGGFGDALLFGIEEEADLEASIDADLREGDPGVLEDLP